jgi:ribosome-binding protein aMBF1 (putative translation factor)
MAKLSDVRRRFPPEDAAAYERAYAEAELAEDLGTFVYSLRVAADLSEAELAARMGVDEDDVLRAEEGDAALTVAFVDAVARAVGVRVRMTATAVLEVTLGGSDPPPPPPPTLPPGG